MCARVCVFHSTQDRAPASPWVPFGGEHCARAGLLARVVETRAGRGGDRLGVRSGVYASAKALRTQTQENKRRLSFCQGTERTGPPSLPAGESCRIHD